MTKQEVRRAIGYVRVSTTEERQGAGMTGQGRAVEQYASQRGWAAEVVREEGSGASVESRPALQDALGRLARHEADALIVAKLDRLSRSLVDFADILRRAEREGWVLVVLDPELDMSTAGGRAMAGMLAVFAEFERSMIRERIKSALAVKRSQGVKLGRREHLGEHVTMMLRRRAGGASLSDIRRSLRALGVESSLSVISRTIARHQRKAAA
jgi:DNA invertase Pin-like site-specific DNA recombinase